jgi:lipid II:glycine glycyltransferase (peptidoglycan interpeptide bridge formation enzyme)
MAFQSIIPSAAAWDAFVGAHPRAHLLQLSAWGDLKAAFGWRPVRVALTDSGGQIVAGALLLLRPFPFRLGALAYVPYGPLVDWSNAEQVRAVLAALDQAARQHRAVFLKIEPGFDLPSVDFAAWGFRRSPQTIQPPRTVTLDISGDDEAILARMNQGTRRNIRKSIKNNIEIRQGTRADVASFNALLAETGDRAAFGVHTPAYYERAYDGFVSSGRAALILGRAGGQDLAGVMVFALQNQAWYFYGASSDRERPLMASYGVQWAGIQWAKAQGATRYDMVGVPDVEPDQLEAQFEQRADGLWGVYRFKRGWGGTVIRSVGAWDRVYHSPLYAVYQLASKVIIT